MLSTQEHPARKRRLDLFSISLAVAKEMSHPYYPNQADPSQIALKFVSQS